jgi:DNA-binding NarL/FixJ family response regulator
LVIADQPVVRLGLTCLLDNGWDVEEAGTGEDGLQLLTDVGDFDIAIVDMRVTADHAPGSLSGAATIRALSKANPGLGIVGLGERPERHIAREAIAAGASAYVARSSPSEEISKAIDAAATSEQFIDPATPTGRRGGGRALTKRQREILQLFANGHSTARVAKRLGLSSETVKTHTKQILSRLEARDRAHAVAIGLRNYLID